MPTDATIQIVTIIATLAALFGWVIKRIINYFIDQIKVLIAQNQENVENFTNTINHNQTKMNTSVDNLAGAIRDLKTAVEPSMRKNKRRTKT